MKDELKLIVFDLGGTVFSKGKQAFMDILAKKLNTDRKNIEIAVDGSHAIEYRKNEISVNEYWKRVKELLPNSLSKDEDLEKLWFDQYFPLAGMPEIISKLRGKYKIAYLSNNTKERVLYLQNKYNFLDWFDGGLFSYETGLVKADGKIYDRLLAKFPGISSNQTLIIDDRIQNLEKLPQFNFHTLVFESPEQLNQALKEKGIF